MFQRVFFGRKFRRFSEDGIAGILSGSTWQKTPVSPFIEGENDATDRPHIVSHRPVSIVVGGGSGHNIGGA